MNMTQLRLPPEDAHTFVKLPDLPTVERERANIIQLLRDGFNIDAGELSFEAVNDIADALAANRYSVGFIKIPRKMAHAHFFFVHGQIKPHALEVAAGRIRDFAKMVERGVSADVWRVWSEGIRRDLNDITNQNKRMAALALLTEIETHHIHMEDAAETRKRIPVELNKLADLVDGPLHD